MVCGERKALCAASAASDETRQVTIFSLPVGVHWQELAKREEKVTRDVGEAIRHREVNEQSYRVADDKGRVETVALLIRLHESP